MEKRALAGGLAVSATGPGRTGFTHACGATGLGGQTDDAGSPAAMSATEEVAQLYRDLCMFSIAKDADGLRSLLTPEYELVHMTGMVQTGEEYIAAVLDGTLNYYSAEHDGIDVRIEHDGGHASIRGRSRTAAAVFGGGRRTWRLQQDLRAVKRDGAWRLVESRASTY